MNRSSLFGVGGNKYVRWSNACQTCTNQHEVRFATLVKSNYMETGPRFMVVQLFTTNSLLQLLMNPSGFGSQATVRKACMQAEACNKGYCDV